MHDSNGSFKGNGFNSTKYAEGNSLRDTRSQSVKMRGTSSNQISDPTENAGQGDSNSKKMSDDSKEKEEEIKEETGDNANKSMSVTSSKSIASLN